MLPTHTVSKPSISGDRETLKRPTTAAETSLVINEIYLSIQGESSYSGLPCVFVRTTGCPLRCRWCDTEYAFHQGTSMSVPDIVSRVLRYDVELVEITGGEPLVQPGIHDLMTQLLERNKRVLLETSGAFDIAKVDSRVHVIMDIKCPDSGEAGRTCWTNLEVLKPTDEVKFVISGRRDYEFARKIIREQLLAQKCQVLLSSVIGRVEQQRIAQWVLADRLPVRFQLQLHKYIWPADTRGV